MSDGLPVPVSMAWTVREEVPMRSASVAWEMLASLRSWVLGNAGGSEEVGAVMQRIGFLSFGHWGPGQGSRTRSAAEALLQGIELAVAAEEIGIDGAFFRVHHFARQQASPFPLLAAIAARTSRIEFGTGVIDMRYENPLYMAEEAAATDLISGGRLQLGISRGSPEPARNGAAAFGYTPEAGETDADMARRHTAQFRQAVSGAGVAEADPRYAGGARGLLPVQPQSPGLDQRIWWGAGSRNTAVWAARLGMNLMSSTLLTEDTGVPFDQLQAAHRGRGRQPLFRRQRPAGHPGPGGDHRRHDGPFWQELRRRT